ncbi:hypothetical protein EUBDOL_01957 [Amedibacillus dolichus DSM 3991]|uniref:Uncharacterized protein n=1 Tax=Amedibacillus dolichus DSM 3991 TaxID=428127 RepID=A8RDI8_9FIRM|nr:hypothetical protein EUBDOL_01957 [Amedibacillus dolichus DSM 3991]
MFVGYKSFVLKSNQYIYESKKYIYKKSLLIKALFI